jgi:hypothetical protein
MICATGVVGFRFHGRIGRARLTFDLRSSRGWISSQLVFSGDSATEKSSGRKRRAGKAARTADGAARTRFAQWGVLSPDTHPWEGAGQRAGPKHRLAASRA